MKRDMDLIRELLLQMEKNPQLDGMSWVHPNTPSDIGITGHSAREVGYHLELLIEAGLVKGTVGMEEIPVLNKITWEGHEFLDDIRDPDIWDKTKQRAKGISSVGVSLIWEIAKAEIKKKLGLP